MTKTGPRDDTKLAAIKLEWWPRSDWNRWPPSLESAVQLAHGQHAFAVALFIEGDRHVEPREIVVHVRAVLDLQQPWRDHAQEHHAVLIAGAVRAGVDEPPAPAFADVDLQQGN